MRMLVVCGPDAPASAQGARDRLRRADQAFQRAGPTLQSPSDPAPGARLRQARVRPSPRPPAGRRCQDARDLQAVTGRYLPHHLAECRYRFNYGFDLASRIVYATDRPPRVPFLRLTFAEIRP